MEVQEWRRGGRRHGAPRSSSTAPATGTASAVHGPHVPKVLSENKPMSCLKKAANTNGEVNGGARGSQRGQQHEEAVPPPSRWREMRQSVRIQAKMDTEDRRVQNARIADLCPQDREKVAKLIRRIVDVGALHEASESEFRHQRALMETEIRELRDQVRQDAQDMDEISDKLKSALLKVRDYQERVLVLEEGNDLEARHRSETELTVDQLKNQVEKLRKLVQKQKDEMQQRELDQQARHRQEMDHAAQKLKDVQEQLLQERRERLQEKQRELEERLQRSKAPSEAHVSPVSHVPSLPEMSGNCPTCTTRAEPSPTPSRDFIGIEQTAPTAHASERGSVQLDMSSFLNTSAELPEKIKDIMDEWKQRMHSALNGTATSIRLEEPSPGRTVSTIACQTDGCDVQKKESFEDDRGRSDHQGAAAGARLHSAPSVTEKRSRSVHAARHQETPRHHGQRSFDRYLVDESEMNQEIRDAHTFPVENDRTACTTSGQIDSRARSPVGRESHEQAAWVQPLSSTSPTNCRENVTNGDDVDETMALIHAIQETEITDASPDEGAPMSRFPRYRPQTTHEALPQSPQRTRSTGFNRLGLYDTSLLDVLHAIESTEDTQSRQSEAVNNEARDQRTVERQAADSPSTRVASLIQGVYDREQKLARVVGDSARREAPEFHENTDPTFWGCKDRVDFNRGVHANVYDGYGPSNNWLRHRPDYSSLDSDDDDQSYSEDESDAHDGEHEFIGPPLSARDLSVREAIEKDLEDLLRDQSFQANLQRRS